MAPVFSCEKSKSMVPWIGRKLPDPISHFNRMELDLNCVKYIFRSELGPVGGAIKIVEFNKVVTIDMGYNYSFLSFDVSGCKNCDICFIFTGAVTCTGISSSSRAKFMGLSSGHALITNSDLAHVSLVDLRLVYIEKCTHYFKSQEGEPPANII